MKRISKRISARLKIVAATATVIFTLLTVFTSTIAWFSTKASATVSGGSFTVKPVSGIQYDLYYLDHFVDSEDETINYDGNCNVTYSIYSGYEKAQGTPVFECIHFNDAGQIVNSQNEVIDNPALNPTNINNLWPAHRLTYAIVIYSGDFQSFSLESWTDNRNQDVVARKDNGTTVQISLSWATNLYGAAFNVAKSYQNAEEDVESELATGFASYINPQASLADAMGYSQDNDVTNPKPVLPITSTAPGTPTSSQRQILYFSIEFDDSDSTYYQLQYDDSNSSQPPVPYYVKNTSGNSNCYKGLSLSDLVFRLA